jgi:hypothetical protein
MLSCTGSSANWWTELRTLDRSMVGSKGGRTYVMADYCVRHGVFPKTKTGKILHSQTTSGKCRWQKRQLLIVKRH